MEDSLRTIQTAKKWWPVLVGPAFSSLHFEDSLLRMRRQQQEEKEAEAALQRKRRELDDLLRQGTQQYYSAAYAGPERVKSAILKTAVGKRWGAGVAGVVAQMVPAPDPQHFGYDQLAEAYLDHLLAHEEPAPGPYRTYLEGKRIRLRAAPRLSLWKKMTSYIRRDKSDNSEFQSNQKSYQDSVWTYGGISSRTSIRF